MCWGRIEDVGQTDVTNFHNAACPLGKKKERFLEVHPSVFLKWSGFTP